MSTEKKLRDCPLCGGEIFALAIKCKHCKVAVRPLKDGLSEDEYRVLVQQASNVVDVNYKNNIVNDKTVALNRTNTKPIRKGNTASNINQWGFAAYSDGWIYYANDLDGKCIYKVANAGGESYKITKNGAQSINVIDDKIYYVGTEEGDGVYSVNIDGTEQKKIVNHNVSKLMVTEDSMFFLDFGNNNRLCRADSDGGNVRCVIDSYIDCYDIYEDWIIYLAFDSDRKLYKIKIDGSEKTKLYDVEIHTFALLDEWVYLVDALGLYILRGRFEASEFFAITDITDSQETTPLEINFTEDWIYYTALFDDNTLYKLNLLGTEVIKVLDLPIHNINVVGDWLYCRSSIDSAIIVINKNGIGAKRVDNSPIDDLIAADKERKAEARINAEKKAAEEKLEAASVVNLVGRGNTSFNIANKGLACECDGWIYYIDGADKDSIHKIRTDGSNDIKINKESSDYLNVIGEWIVYRNWPDFQRIHRIKIDGGESKRVHDKGTSLVKVVDDWIYYQGEISFETEEHRNLYRIKLDGTMEQRIGDVKIDSFDVFNDWIYYTDINNRQLYCMRPDGSEKQIIYDDYVEALLGTNGEWLYFISLDNLHRLNLNNGELNRLTIYGDDNESISASMGNIADNWFYFAERYDDERLCRVNFEGSGLEVLVNEAIEYINIAGGWLFYKKQVQVDIENSNLIIDENVYRIKLDHPISDEVNETLDRADTETEIIPPAEMVNVVYTDGLKIVIPEGYIYTVDPSETGGRVIVAMNPVNDSITSIDEDFRMNSVESFTISAILSLNKDIDIDSNGGPLISMMMNMFPGETELIEAKSGLAKYFNELMPQGENDICIIYSGFLISEKATIYNLQVQFNYNDGNYDLMKQKTIDIMKGIEYTGENVDGYNQGSSLDEPISQNVGKGFQLIHNGSLRLSDEPDKAKEDVQQADTELDPLADSVNALKKLKQDVEKLNEHLENLKNIVPSQVVNSEGAKIENGIPFSGLPLDELSDADFEADGRIMLSIRQYLDDALTDIKVRTPVVECKIANDLFVNMVNIVDFFNYRDHIVGEIVGNQAGMTMKGLFLYTIRSFFWTMRKYDQSAVVKDYYIALFNDMLKYFFSPSEPIANEQVLRAFGIFGIKYKNGLLPLLNEFMLLSDDNLLCAKLSYIYESVRAMLARENKDLAICGDKINAIRLLQYLSDDVVYFKPDNVVFDGDKRVMKGLEANAEYFWSHPEILFDFEAFGSGLSSLIDDLEDDIMYRYSLSEVDEDGHQFFNYEDVTGFSFLNLFATEAADFYRDGEDSYEVYLDIDLELSHSEFKDRIAGLIYDLGKYNDHYIDPDSIRFTNSKSYTKSISDDFSLTPEEMGFSIGDLSSQQSDKEMADTKSIKVSGDYQVAYPPDHISAFHRQHYATGLATIGFQKSDSGQINIQINRGVELSMEAVKTGIFAPPYDNKKAAWEFARVFRVDDSAFKGSYDREAEIQQPYIRSVAFLSALRSFAWTFQGYLENTNRSIEDVSIEEIHNIVDFIEQRGLLNYTSDSHFPALCGVADFNAAYIPLSSDDPYFAKTCKLTECKSCGDLFALRSELTALTPVMEMIRNHLFENRKYTTEQLTGTLSDILYAWCALSLASDGAFRIVEGPLSYYLDIDKGGVENFSLPYWEGDDDD